jgi:hypothetical protein
VSGLTTLDVGKLERDSYVFSDGTRRVDLVQVTLRTHPVIQAMMGEGLVPHKSSFGYAVAYGGTVGAHAWDEPYASTMFVGGWGLKGEVYIANAVRKLRAVLRTGMDTARLAVIQTKGQGRPFLNPVTSINGDGTMSWGDFAYAGGVIVRVGETEVPVAVSALPQIDDDTVAKYLGGYVGAAMNRVLYPDLFDA